MAEEYTCSLSERDLKVAKEELGEDPKERLGQVQTFRQWILQQPHIKCDTDMKYLLRFLRVSKFSQLRARQRLENFLTGKVKFPEWMAKIDMADPKIQKVLESGHMLLLPSRPDGKKVWMYRGRYLDTSNKHYTKVDVMRCMIGLVLHCLQEEATQVHGITFLLDLTDTPMSSMTYMGMDDIRRCMSLWQGAFPARLKGFHYYNPGTIFEAVMLVIKPVMSKKLQDRIQVYGSNMEEVYKQFPMSILPDEYLPDDYSGPSAGSVQSIVDKMKADMNEPVIRNRLLQETSDNFSIDISKQDKDEPQASFRKLNVE